MPTTCPACGAEILDGQEEEHKKVCPGAKKEGDQPKSGEQGGSGAPEGGSQPQQQ